MINEFGSMVFNENVMRSRLKDATFKKLMKIRKESSHTTEKQMSRISWWRRTMGQNRAR